MKHMKQLLCAALAAAALLLCCCTSVYAQEGAPVQFVVLGDSIAEGAGAVVKSNAYASRIAKTRGYALTNYAVGGDTSAALLEKLTENQDIRASVRAADVLAVSIGGNDFYHAVPLILNGLLDDYTLITPRLEALRENFAGIITQLRTLNPEAVLVVQTLYNPIFPFLPPALYEAYDGVVREINGVIRGYLARHPGAYRIADVYTAFRGRYGAVFIDMTHPSDFGHALIATVVMNAIDGKEDSLPAPSALLHLPERLLRPVFALEDWALAGALRFVHDSFPPVWAYLTRD